MPLKRYKCKLFASDRVITEACDSDDVARLENQVDGLQRMLAGNNLEPCPFCGGSANVELYDVPLGGDHHVTMYTATCYGCGVRTPVQAARGVCELAWNTRHKQE